jgi:hypothetical protein
MLVSACHSLSLKHNDEAFTQAEMYADYIRRRPQNELDSNRCQALAFGIIQTPLGRITDESLHFQNLFWAFAHVAGHNLRKDIALGTLGVFRSIQSNARTGQTLQDEVASSYIPPTLSEYDCRRRSLSWSRKLTLPPNSMLFRALRTCSTIVLLWLPGHHRPRTLFPFSPLSRRTGKMGSGVQ